MRYAEGLIFMLSVGTIYIQFLTVLLQDLTLLIHSCIKVLNIGLIVLQNVLDGTNGEVTHALHLLIHLLHAHAIDDQHDQACGHRFL